MAWLNEKGVDAKAMIDVTGEIIKLHDMSLQGNFNLVKLPAFVVEQRTKTINERSCKVA